jgi:hypothetical protein
MYLNYRLNHHNSMKSTNKSIVNYLGESSQGIKWSLFYKHNCFRPRVEVLNHFFNNLFVKMFCLARVTPTSY